MIFRTCHELWNSVGPLYQLLLQHFFPWKKDSIEGLMSSNISSCFTLFSTSANTFKFERTNVSTVWLLHNKWYGWWLEPSALGIVFSIPIFFWTASVINSSTFLHKVAGVVFRFCWDWQLFEGFHKQLCDLIDLRKRRTVAEVWIPGHWRKWLLRMATLHQLNYD